MMVKKCKIFVKSIDADLLNLVLSTALAEYASVV